MSRVFDMIPFQIVRSLAEGDHWDSEGNCRVCGGNERVVIHDDGVQRYEYVVSDPGTHDPSCPWLRAQRYIKYRDASTVLVGNAD